MKLALHFRPTEISLLAATVGVSFSTVIGGSAAVYFGSIGVAGVCCILHLTRSGRLLSFPSVLAIGISTWLILAHFVRETIGYGQYLFPSNDVPKITAIYIILLIVVCTSSMPGWLFRRSFTIVALAHVAILTYALAKGDVAVRALSDTGNVARFEGAGFATAAWSEVALGTIMAAVLSGRFLVHMIAFPIGTYAIVAADMRTTLIGAGAIFLILLFATAQKTKKPLLRVWIWLGAGLTVLAIMSIAGGGVFQAISNILLLDDAHRGIASGFSGRFENFAMGWHIFQDNIFWGVGFSDPIANYTHNGYILTLAQMGAPLSLVLFYLLFSSGVRANNSHEYILLATIFGLAIFYMGQPRNLNFQLCPLVGLIAVGRTLLRGSADEQDNRFQGPGDELPFPPTSSVKNQNW